VSAVLPLELSEDRRLSELVTGSLDAVALRPIAYSMLVDVRAMRFGAWRKDDNVYPASVIKVPIMAEAFRRYDAGDLKPDAAVDVTASNQTTTWGGDSPFIAGTRATVQALVERMITHSDNVATNQLMDVLGRARVTDYMRSLGLPTFLLGRKLSGSEPLIEDPDIQKILASSADTSEHLAESAKSVDIAMRPWRERANLLKTILLKAVGMVKFVYPL